MRWSVSKSPTLETLLAMGVIFLLQQLAGIVGPGVGLFALSMPLSVRPWTIVTSVYAHGNLTHLLVNAIAVLVLGMIVERTTTRLRFHAFVVGTGAIAALAEVLFHGFFGTVVPVLGISGAAFALMGYLIAGNPVADAVVGRLELSYRHQVLAVLVLAFSVTFTTGGENVALVAHFTGFALGLLSGRARLLNVRRGDASRPHPKTQGTNEPGR